MGVPGEESEACKTVPKGPVPLIMENTWSSISMIASIRTNQTDRTLRLVARHVGASNVGESHP